MKIYTLSERTVAPALVRKELGLPCNDQRERIYVAATSPMGAAHTARLHGFDIDPGDLPDEADDDMIDALTGGLIFNEGHMFAVRTSTTDTPVVLISAGVCCPINAITILGLLLRVPIMKAENGDGTVVRLIETPGHPRWRFYRLPQPGYAPELSTYERNLIDGFGYSGRWDCFDQQALDAEDPGPEWIEPDSHIDAESERAYYIARAAENDQEGQL